MIIDQDRTELDGALGSEENRVLLFVGGDGSRAKVVHAAMEAAKWDKREIYVQVLDMAKLTAEELGAWFEGAAGDPKDCFVLLRGQSPKTVLMNGRVDALFLPGTDELDFLRVRGLFAGMKFKTKRLP